MSEDPRIKEARRLLWEVTNEQKVKEKERVANEICKCGHKRKLHSVSYNINYTGGTCKKCKCFNYLSK
jgi:hypothetical protein